MAEKRDGEAPAAAKTAPGAVVSDSKAMVAGMEPVTSEKRWVYCFETSDSDIASLAASAFAVIREAEGVTLILPEEEATKCGYESNEQNVMARITLNVYSDLNGVGLTAAVSTALANELIPCNVVAGYHHDHLFVPFAQVQQSIRILKDLQQKAAQE